MVWPILITTIIIAAILWRIKSILSNIDYQIARLRLELGAGLGVNVEHPNGYLDGGDLRELRDYVREQRRLTRDQRRCDADRFSTR